MALFLYFFISFFLIGCATHWDNGDKTLATIFVVEQVADTVQTQRRLKEPGIVEGNPILKDIGPGALPFVKAATTVVVIWAADHMGPVSRKVFLGGLDLVYGIIINHNIKVERRF